MFLGQQQEDRTVPKIDLDRVAQTNTTGYPAEHAGAVQGRWVRRVGKAMGFTDFGVSHVVLKPGAASAHRHWHEGEDEFVVMLAGEAVLVEDEGRTPMHPGDMAAFAKGIPNGHQLLNESEADCVYLAFGRPPAADCHYPDIDLHCFGGDLYRRKDGSDFP
jgi:uncharacterized cupin superfamily protein